MRRLPHRPAWVMLAVGLLCAGESLWSQAPAWQAGVAQVSAKDRSPGTGFVVSLRAGRAYLVTLAHVVAGDPSPSVVFVVDPDNKPYPAQVRNVEEGTDPRALALLQVQNPPAGVHVIEPGADLGLAPDTTVRVAGFPATIGTFTVLRATVASIKGRDFYLTPATEEGFSGGPVLLEDCAVGLVFGREAAFGKAVPAAAVELYLRGHQITWGAEAAKAAPAKPAEVVLRAGTVRVNPNDGQPYVWIPAGEFQMGCSPGDMECADDEKPPRRVRLTRGFWLGQTEVTVGAYKQYAAKMGISMPDEPVLVSTTLNPGWSDAEQPMANITWQEAKSYCESWAKGRLPTEAEWEYAARAGATGARYGALDAIAWYADNSGKERLDSTRAWESDAGRVLDKYWRILERNANRIRRVRQQEANRWGLFDTLGSLWEWIADQYYENYYSTGPDVNPQGPAEGKWRVVRGGSWDNNPRDLRASHRVAVEPDTRKFTHGVRCACDTLP